MRSGQAGSKGRSPLFVVSEQNLNLSSSRIWHTQNIQKWIRDEKIMAPQSRGGRELIKKKNKPQNTAKPVSKLVKISFYVALLLLEFKMICRTEGGVRIAL